MLIYITFFSFHSALNRFGRIDTNGTLNIAGKILCCVSYRAHEMPVSKK